MSSVILLTYQLELTTDSQMFSRVCNLRNFYYETFEVKVPEIRYYTIQSSSDIDTYGYIYENTFNPLNTTENLLTSDDNGGGFDGQFRFEIPLYVDTTYILVVTTSSPNKIGKIKINMLGLANVTFEPLSEYRDCLVNKSYKIQKVFVSSVFTFNLKKPRNATFVQRKSS
jgi:hypothetical protein